MITKYFQDKLQESPLSEVSDNTGKYLMWNDGGVECEVGEFFYGLTRMVKPVNILETGTYKGASSLYFGQALKENGFGRLVTLEIDRLVQEEAMAKWNKVGVSEYIRSILMSALDYEPRNSFQIILLDTEPNIRFKEMVKFVPYLDAGGYMFIHDLHRHLSQEDNKELGFGWPYGPLPDEIKEYLKSGLLRPFHFSTPRGLSGFYKVHPNDYKI